MKDILDTIISRRSVKNFKDIPVEEELIEKIIKAGMFAPSGKNIQSPIIIAITNKSVINNISNEINKVRNTSLNPLYGAPVVLGVLAKKDVFTHVYDGSVVIENMLLEAHSLGLGACWIHHAKEVFERDFGKDLLRSINLDCDEYEGIGFCIVGYANTIPSTPLPRKDNYVYYIK